MGPLDVNEEQLEKLQQRLKTQSLTPDDYACIEVLITTMLFLKREYQEAKLSLKRLLKMIFGGGTERTENVLGKGKKPDKPANVKKPKRKGHGRRAAKDYPGAQMVIIQHNSLRPGDACPACGKGMLRDSKRPSSILRFCAQPMIKATAYVIEQLRCNLCDKVFGATPPAEAGGEKYDTNVAPMLGIMRYGAGMPLNRMEDLQMALGVPMPAGTQWELLKGYYSDLKGVGDELQRQAALGQVMHNDDTSARILELEQKNRARQAEVPDIKIRTGIFTTGIVSITNEHRIALYCTGGQHAGENLQDILEKRPADLVAPIQICDGLSRNEPENKTTMGNCNVHGRRGFVEIAEQYPDECKQVLEIYRQLYQNEAHTTQAKLSAEARLKYHQQHSQPLMDGMKLWMEQKLKNRQVEPNSSLGKAFNYLLKRWEKLTLFLRTPGVPLDNNICERILKTSIRHRNNSLFYKTTNGAQVGDFFMSIIQTCRLNDVNPFDYLTTLHRFAKQTCANLADWMPWNYKTAAASQASP